MKTNQELVERFFTFYMNRELDRIPDVMSENVIWYFLGRHKLAGTRYGIQEVLNFFDTMGRIMSKSNPNVQKLIVAEEKDLLIECQHIQTNREDGINIDHHVTVLWTFEDGKIVSGRHFFADPEAVDRYFDTVAE